MPAVSHDNATASGGGVKNAAMPYTHGMTGVNLSLDDKVTFALWISIIALCSVVLFARVGQMANAHLRHLLNLNASPAQLAYWETDKTTLWPKLKRHVLYAPLRKKRHNKEFMLSSAMNVGTLPSRLHTAILVAYSLSNVAYCALLDYHGRPQAATIAELRGRTGHLAMVNMVPLVVLAGRNNPFIYLLRVSFDTYNLFHRWIGRLVVLEAIVHTIAWAVNAYAAKGSKGVSESLRSSPFLGYGLLGTIAMTLILIQSPSILRHAFYETFLHCHQLLAVAAIIGVWVHCRIGELPGTAYIYWVVALWVLERAARLFRIVYRNVGGGGMTKVRVEALPGAGDGHLEACRVSFELARPWKFSPGTHGYVYLPSVSFWMNHPFSIAWSDTRPTPYLSLEKEIEAGLPSSQSDLDSPKPERHTTTVHLIVAKRTGMTAALYNKARASPSGVITMSGLIEGPYGGNDSLHSYGTVILFAAGIGITHQIGHIRDLLTGHLEGTTATQKVVLVWTVKNTETLEWVRPWMDEILALPNRKQVLKVMLFVTRPRSAREVVSRSETVLMFPGRCDPKVLMEREMETRIGAMAVTVCGPGAFGDDVRAAARGVVDRGTVDFVEEAFTW
ncbi:MAG: hypothetical protein Q9163_005030 [Psora crenata]